MLGNQDKRQQSGNILWFILIAVALLGMLTMVLSRGGSSVDQTGDVEQLRIQAGQILRYAKSIEAAVQDMRLKGISESDISFQNGATNVNANCTTADCRIFSSGGAGLSYRTFTAANGGTDWIFTAANNVGTTAGPVGSTAASTGNDLIMLLPDVGTNLCIQINRDLGVGTPGTLPVDAGIAFTVFDGSYPSGGPTILEGTSGGLELNRQTAGCFIDDTDADRVYFYYVLIAR